MRGMFVTSQAYTSSVRTLFDKTDRTDLDVAGYAECEYPYLNRSARADIGRVRTQLESWFSRYPEKHADELVSRFRSKSDDQHRAALFELFMHDLLFFFFSSLEVHPSLPETPRRPEFLAVFPQTKCYVEAKVANGLSKKQIAAKKRVNLVYDAINDMDSPDYWINVIVQGAPRSLVPATNLKHFLMSKMAELNYDDVSLRFEQGGVKALPCWHYEFEGWVANFSPMPKQHVRGQCGTRPMGVQMSALEEIEPAFRFEQPSLRKRSGMVLQTCVCHRGECHRSIYFRYSCRCGAVWR